MNVNIEGVLTGNEERRRAASKAGGSQPNREIPDVKERLSTLADDVLEGRVAEGKAAVVWQVWETYLHALMVETKIREAEELQARIEDLEELLEERGIV